MLASLSWPAVGFATAQDARPSFGRARGHIFPLRTLDLGASHLVFRRLLRVKAARAPLQIREIRVSVLAVVKNPFILFNIMPLRKKSPVAVQFHFGVKTARNGDLISTKISLNITWYHLVSVNSLLCAREGRFSTLLLRNWERKTSALSRELRNSPAVRDAAKFSREAFLTSFPETIGVHPVSS